MAVVAGPALAAGQQHDHFRDVFTDVDDDFCGTDQRIDIAGNVLVNEWHAPHKGDFKQTASGKITLTQPAHRRHRGQPLCRAHLGRQHLGRPRGRPRPAGHRRGTPRAVEARAGPRLIRDAGYVVLLQTIEDDEVVENEVLIENGPHPELERLRSSARSCRRRSGSKAERTRADISTRPFGGAP